MFGLEKNNKSPLFEFDLQKDLDDDKKYKVLKDRIEKHIQEIKVKIREGAGSEEFEKLGVLLHGYSALLKTITRVKTK